MEEQIINRIAIESALAKLSPSDRELILLAYRYDAPPDYDGPWPPSLEDVGKWWGMKWLGEELTEAGARYKRDEIKKQWRGQGRKRRNRRNRPKTTP